MKRLTALLAAIAVIAMSACTTNPATGKLAPIDLTQTKFSQATHADLMAAAKYATDHGLPAIAAVYAAQDQLGTAILQQINACNAAIAANMPQVVAPPSGAGPILAFEVAREAVGQISGIPASVKLACEPITLPSLPILPKL